MFIGIDGLFERSLLWRGLVYECNGVWASRFTQTTYGDNGTVCCKRATGRRRRGEPPTFLFIYIRVIIVALPNLRVIHRTGYNFEYYHSAVITSTLALSRTRVECPAFEKKEIEIGSLVLGKTSDGHYALKYRKECPMFCFSCWNKHASYNTVRDPFRR